MVTDIILLLVAFLFSLFGEYKYWPSNIFTIEYSFLFILIFVWVISARITALYDDTRDRNYSVDLINLIKNVIVQALSAIVFIFLATNSHFSRMFVVRYSFILFFLIGTEKFLFRTILKKFRQKGRNLRNILIVGAGEVGQRFFDTINKNPNFGYRLLGFLDDEKKSFLNGKYLGPIENLERVFGRLQIDEVIIALPNYAENKVHDIISTCENQAVRVRIIPDYFKFLSQKYSVSMFGSFPLISVRDEKLNEFHWRLLKRAFDTSLSLVLFIVIFSWLWPLIALIIKLDSKGPVFYRQERWGRNNKMFVVYKFRSMLSGCSDVDKDGNFLQACKNDPRITRVGRILRKTNIDELPQLFNVLKGEMSIVGPRPHPTSLNLESKKNIKQYMLRHMAKPGITGWAQVNGYRGETKDPVLMLKRVEYDLWYIENWTFWLDVEIIYLTVLNMLKGDKNAY
jgi:putative colanic acid biosynthesis UDP-glucose lipid carrier transferase